MKEKLHGKRDGEKWSFMTKVITIIPVINERHIVNGWNDDDEEERMMKM